MSVEHGFYVSTASCEFKEKGGGGHILKGVSFLPRAQVLQAWEILGHFQLGVGSPCSIGFLGDHGSSLGKT